MCLSNGKYGIEYSVAIVLSMALAVAIGIFNGALISVIGIPAIIATFASQIIFKGAAYLLSGGVPIYGFDERFKVIGRVT